MNQKQKLYLEIPTWLWWGQIQCSRKSFEMMKLIIAWINIEKMFVEVSREKTMITTAIKVLKIDP